MQIDEEAYSINYPEDAPRKEECKHGTGTIPVQRLTATILVAAALFIAATMSFHGASEDVQTFNNHRRLLEQGTIFQSEIFVDEFSGGVIGDINVLPEIKLGHSRPYHPEKIGQVDPAPIDFETFDLEDEDPYIPWQNDTDSVWAHEFDEILEEPPIEHRELQHTAPDYLYPLPCNDGVKEVDCTTPLSSLPVPTDGLPLVIPCGTCVIVDASDGQQLELPKGLRIEGKLYFPPEASITIRTIHVMVLGILKMDTPLLGNQVKISLYGELDENGKELDQYFTANDAQQVSTTDACEGGCKVGKKVIAVVGGELDIQGYDPTCPSWEQAQEISEFVPPPPLGSPTAAPTLSKCVGNLFENGDFSDPSGSTHPFHGYASATKLHQDVVNPGNTAIQVINRPNWAYGIYARFEEDCFKTAEASNWKLEMDVRLLDEVTGEGIDCDPGTNNVYCPIARFQASLPGGSYPQWFYYDPEMEWNKDGWSHFSIDISAPEEWQDANWLQIIISGGPDRSDLVVDNIRFERYYGEVTRPIDYNQIHISQKAAECWTPGSEILITSNTWSPSGHQLATIESANPETGIIKLTSTIDPVSTLVSDPNHAVEVALLNRRIIFEADDAADDDLIGGHLIILKTPNVKQHLEGVEIRNFGQQGTLGRYPVHFHWCEDVTGSVVKKNVVRQSNQRCYVMHGSNGALIEDNVAFDTFGHCYMTEDGLEHSNHFIRNLGAYVKKATRLLNDFSKRVETDDKPSVFWLSSMENYYEGNVAAGSEQHGFWVETHRTIRSGAIYQRPDHVPMFANLGSFKDNTAHSFASFGLTLYPPGWHPEERAILENFRVYRGFGEGIFVHNVNNVSFKGGYVAQIGRLGLFIFAADDIEVDGMEFVGTIDGDVPHCANKIHQAIKLYPHRSPTHHKPNPYPGVHFGAKLHNLKFSNWSPMENCKSNVIEISTTQVSWPGWDAYNLLDNIVYDGSSDTFFSACEYEDEVTGDAAIEISGDASSVYGGPGYLVGPTNVPLSGSQCVDVGGCLNFCPDACLRTIKFKVSGSRDVYNYVMIVDDGIQKATVNRFGTLYPNTEPKYWEVSTFSISLPDGDFTVWFEDPTNPGVKVYPKFVLPSFEAEPTCSGYVTQESITILKPANEERRCDNLVHNGDFATNIAGWQEWSAGSSFVENAGVHGSGALVTTGDRNGQYHGHTLITQWLDTSCLVDNAGVYLFEFSYRVVDQIDDITSAQNVLNLSKTPTFYLRFEGWDEEKQELKGAPSSWPEERPISTPTPTLYDPNDIELVSDTKFTVVKKAFTISEEQTSIATLRLIIQNFESHIIIDNVSLVKDGLFGGKALGVMKHIVETMQPTFEASTNSALPVSASDLDLLLGGFSADVRAYADGTFPGGVSAMSSYDEGLSDDLPSFETYISSVLPALGEQYTQANADAIAAANKIVEDDWRDTVNEVIELAIEKAVDDLINVLQDDVQLSYLDSTAFQNLQDKLALITESKRDSCDV